jgi:hypothetical protein
MLNSIEKTSHRFGVPQQTSKDAAYTDLVCTEQDKAKIIEIITLIANNNKCSLLFKQNHLKSLGKEVDHVHPLKFLSVGMSTPYLKSCYVTIFGDYFKRNGVMVSLAPSLNREAEKRKLDQYLAPFAKEMGVPIETLRTFTEARDWEGLLQFLMKSGY